MTEVANTEIVEQTISNVRAVMRRDDACDRVVPSDLRILIGEIDRLRARLPENDPGAAPDPFIDAAERAALGI